MCGGRCDKCGEVHSVTYICDKEAVNNSAFRDGLSDFASLADELDKEGNFLINPDDHETDRASGNAYKECAKRIREIIGKTKGR